MKNQERSVLISKREAPKSARPRGFARFAQWLIQSWQQSCCCCQQKHNLHEHKGQLCVQDNRKFPVLCPDRCDVLFQIKTVRFDRKNDGFMQHQWSSGFCRRAEDYLCKNWFYLIFTEDLPQSSRWEMNHIACGANQWTTNELHIFGEEWFEGIKN